MSPLKYFLDKPHYVCRPGQLFRRLAHTLRGVPPGQLESAALPWGLTIQYHSEEMIGSSIRRTGIFDLCVTEALWRLLEPGETALDIGANIGYMTSVMAARVGKDGQVLSFEPHPEIFRELSNNVHSWNNSPLTGRIEAYKIAMSDRVGAGWLATTPEFASNRGTATLLTGATAGEDTALLNVSILPLDEFPGLPPQIGVMKVDVEGHEAQVFQGAKKLLAAGRVRDIVFEEHSPYPTAVTGLLESAGYTLFVLDQAPSGPVAAPVTEFAERRLQDAPNYLATREPARALDRLRKRGWATLSPRRADERKAL